jgi:hypothetical protein
MDMTRRTFGTGALGFGLAGASGARLEALELPWDMRLEADLGARLVSNPSRARFSVPGLEVTREGRASVRMIAQARLDWSPGFRLRHFEAGGETAEEAYFTLRHIAFGAFAGVVPGFLGPDPGA